MRKEPPTHKVCVHCKVDKPITEFHKYSQNNPANNRYYRPYCKACKFAYCTRPEKNKSHKTCKGCERTLTKHHFVPHRDYKFGLHNYCHECLWMQRLAERIISVGKRIKYRPDRLANRKKPPE